MVGQEVSAYVNQKWVPAFMVFWQVWPVFGVSVYPMEPSLYLIFYFTVFYYYPLETYMFSNETESLNWRGGSEELGGV